MPKKRTSMKKIREIIRLTESGLSQRQISKALDVCRPVISETIQKIHNTDLTYSRIKEMRDTEIEEILSCQICSSGPRKKSDKLKDMFPEYAKELKKTGVTLRLLWEEYQRENPEGLKYTQFCYHFQQWKKDEKISMHIEHKAGEKMYVDYTGQKMEITDRKSGNKRTVEVFVAILPASQLTYAEASESQKQEDFVRSNERALRYFGGCPAVIVPDNLKSGVIKANYYEPDLNPLFADFAEYYQTAVIPARARKPKDKAHVENAVKIIYQRVFAPLRNQEFYSLQELNEAIKIRLDDHNNRKLSKMTVSRRELFEATEKDILKPLPISPYPLKYTQPNTLVQFNYHVELKADRHYYSVPYSLRGKRVKLIYDERNVSIFHDNIRVAIHKRDRKNNRYSTYRDHMPRQHRFDENWNPEKLRTWAMKIGSETHQAISYILDSKPHPEQAYKSCLGILNHAQKHGRDILNMACRVAWNSQQISYGFISDQIKIIKNQYQNEEEQPQRTLLPPLHENVRGEQYYN